MPIALVRQTTVTSPSATSPETFSIGTPTAGNALILSWGTSSNTQAITGITGGGVTWVKAISSASQRDCEVWYGLNSSGGIATMSISFSGGGSPTTASNVSEWSGFATSGSLVEITGINSASTGTVHTTATITTTNSADLIIATERCLASGALSSGPTNSFTPLNTPSSQLFNTAYLLPGATGNYVTTWTHSLNTAYDAVIVAFVPTLATINNSAMMSFFY